jgi:hypothetical protein
MPQTALWEIKLARAAGIPAEIQIEYHENKNPDRPDRLVSL